MSGLSERETSLLPCPFCNGEAEVINCLVHCNSPFCEAQPFTAGQSAAEAIAAWNRRPSAEDAPGELDPRTALATARQMLAYAQSFNGQSWGGVDESVDRKNLATALDNLEETASMLLNMADRVALARRPSVGGVTDAQIDATTDEQWGRRDDSTYYAAHRSYARAVLALQPSAPQPVPQAEGMEADAWLKEAKALLTKVTLEAELFWWNDGPSGKSAADLRAAEISLLAHLSKRVSPSPAIQQAVAQAYVDMIHSVEQRCMAADGPVTPTHKEITDAELRAVYLLALDALGEPPR
jgi:hypothetical protein